MVPGMASRPRASARWKASRVAGSVKVLPKQCDSRPPSRSSTTWRSSSAAPKVQDRSVKSGAKPSSRFEWISTSTGCAAISASASTVASVVATSSCHSGSRKVKYWPRLPTDVAPAASAATVFSTAEGMPITKSPKCGATGASEVSATKSSMPSRIMPVPRPRSARLARGWPIDQSRQMP